jgi:hypothetical protein
LRFKALEDFINELKREDPPPWGNSALGRPGSEMSIERDTQNGKMMEI